MPVSCPDDPEPCDTGNEVIDAIEDVMEELWENSNVDAENLNERVERGGWIIKTPNGFRVEPFPTDENWTYTACGIQSPPGYPQPANTVGTIHTHPYEVGTDISAICDQDKKTPYQGIASEADITIQRNQMSHAMQQGYIDNVTDFTTLVLDKDGIQKSDGFLTLAPGLNADLIKEFTSNYHPCGYK